MQSTKFEFVLNLKTAKALLLLRLLTAAFGTKKPAAKRQRMSAYWDSSDLDGKVGPCVAILVYTADRLSRSKPKGLMEPVHLGRKRKAGERSVSGIGTSAPLREDRGKLAIC
jgi:hypothetical protein